MQDNTQDNPDEGTGGFESFARQPSDVDFDHRLPAVGTPDPELSRAEQQSQPQPEPTQDSTAERANIVSSVYPSYERSAEPVPPVKPWNEQAQHQPAAATGSPETQAAAISMPVDDRPVPVVKVLSVRGVEYAMMSILLWFGAGSLIAVLASIIAGGSSFESLAFPISLLLVCLPGFAYFFLRLRKAELANPALRLEASKRRYSQITQILAFLTCFFNIVTVVFSILSLAGGSESVNIGKVLGVAAVVLVVAGGILFYYWQDEHKLVK